MHSALSRHIYTDWSFYSDEAAGFHHLGTPTNMVQGPIEAKSDETLDLTLYRSSAAMGEKQLRIRSTLSDATGR